MKVSNLVRKDLARTRMSVSFAPAENSAEDIAIGGKTSLTDLISSTLRTHGSITKRSLDDNNLLVTRMPPSRCWLPPDGDGCDGRQVEVVYSSGATYVGCVRTCNGRPHGYGAFSWPNGSRYVGQFDDGRRHGLADGRNTYSEGAFESSERCAELRSNLWLDCSFSAILFYGGRPIAASQAGVLMQVSYTGAQGGPDLNRYDGGYNNGYLHGAGRYQWPNGEVYNGSFYKDRRHGFGSYRWPDGCRYLGMFYTDVKEGYGTLWFPDGRRFQGLYVHDERLGPGLVTYPDGRSNLGIWQRDRLVRLCHRVTWTPGFSLSDCGYTSPCQRYETQQPNDASACSDPLMEKRRLESIPVVRRRVDQLPPDCCCCSCDEDDLGFRPDVERVSAAVVSDLLPLSSLAADVQTYDEAFFADVSRCNCAAGPQLVKNDVTSHRRTGSSELVGVSSAATNSTNSSVVSAPVTGNEPATNGTCSPAASTSPPLLASNLSPSHVAMQRHVARFWKIRPAAQTGSGSDSIAAGEGGVELDVDAVMTFDPLRLTRPSSERGPMELLSERLIKAAAEGKRQDVDELLDDTRVSPDVADCIGQTPLLAASVCGQNDVINCLLDHGADVNRLSDDGVSSLSACFALLFPPSTFLVNFADRDRLPAADLPREPIFKPLQPDAPVGRGKTVATSDGAKSRPGDGEMTLPSTATPTIGKANEEQIAIVVENGGASPRSVVERDVADCRDEPQGSRRYQLAGSPANDDLSTERGEFTSSTTRTIGRICVRRSPKVDVETALAVKPIPEILFDSNGQIVVRESEQETISLPSVQQPNARILHCATELNDGLSDAPPGDVVGTPTEPDIHPVSSTSAPPMSRALPVIGGDEEQQSEAVESRRRRCVLQSTIDLLLRRGASPNASFVPMPVLFFAVRRGEPEEVHRLLLAGADPDAALPSSMGGLRPLHFACGLLGACGVEIVRLLLDAGADRNARVAAGDDGSSYVIQFLEKDWQQDAISDQCAARLGGRTALHIVCARDDNFQEACQMLDLLLNQKADTELMCFGHTPLTLAIVTGNDEAVRRLIKAGADPNAPLTHGVGNALCVAVLPQSELRRPPNARKELIDTLLDAGADILLPVAVGPKHQIGNVVDFAHYVYSQGPTSHLESPVTQEMNRINASARVEFLEHLGHRLRDAAVMRQKQQTAEDSASGDKTRHVGCMALGADSVIQPSDSVKQKPSKTPAKLSNASKVSLLSQSDAEIRVPAYRYCYECGRSLNVQLTPCSRCQKVLFCSTTCQAKSWSTVHNDECILPDGGKTDSADDGDGTTDDNGSVCDGIFNNDQCDETEVKSEGNVKAAKIVSVKREVKKVNTRSK